MKETLNMTKRNTPASFHGYCICSLIAESIMRLGLFTTLFRTALALPHVENNLQLTALISTSFDTILITFALAAAVIGAYTALRNLLP